MTKRLSLGYPYHLVKSSGGRGGGSFASGAYLKKEKTADTCLSSAYTRVVAPRGLHFHACSHIFFSLRSRREIRYFEFVVQFTHSREYGFQNPGNFCCRIRNPLFWNPENSPRTPESKTVLDSFTWGDSVVLQLNNSPCLWCRCVSWTAEQVLKFRQNPCWMSEWRTLSTPADLMRGCLLSEEENTRGVKLLWTWNGRL